MLSEGLLFTSQAFVLLALCCFDTFGAWVKVVTPTDGSEVGNATLVRAETSGADISEVVFKVDGADVSAPQKTPYQVYLAKELFPKGLHTIMAVGTTVAGTKVKSDWIRVLSTNPPAYTLNSGPYNVEDLGSILAANTQDRQFMFRLPNGDLHLLLYYVVADDWKYPFQILDANLSAGTARLTDGVLGRPGPATTALHPNNGRIYLGTGSPGHLLEYDPATGGTNYIGKLATITNGANRVAASIEIGDDGWVYVGEQSPPASVERYNPDTRAFEDIGAIDIDFQASQYAYTIGADTRYVYVGLGQQPWYLGVYDNQTRTKTIYWKDQIDKGGGVYRGVSGGWYYWRSTSEGNKYYVLTNGQPLYAGTSIASIPPIKSSYNRGNVVNEVSQFPLTYNTEVDLSDVYPDSVSNRAVIRWRQVGNDFWNSIDTANVGTFRLQALAIKRVYPFNGRLFCIPDFYGPVCEFRVTDRTTTKLGPPIYSLYNAVFEKNAVYLSGYPGATLVYEPWRSWNLNRSTSDWSPASVNPHPVLLGLGRYHYYSTFGADGLVYIASHHERNSVGGELGWYDPTTGANGSLREPFTDITNDVEDLKPALGGSKLVYASRGGYLHIFDVATKRIERKIKPNLGVDALDKVVEVSPGVVLGVVSNRLFKVDILDGSTLFTKDLPGQVFGGPSIMPAYNHRLALGPDGYVWLFIDNSLYRVNPSDGSMVRILDGQARSLMFDEGDLYLHGGPNLYRIRRIMAEVVGPASQLKVPPHTP